MNKTIIIGDCHIGSGQSIGKTISANSLNTRITDQLNILNWILSIGLENDVDKFIFTGDIFEDLKPDHNLVVLFLEWLKSCSQHGISCYIIAGNHDLKRVGARYSSVLDIIQSAEIENVLVYNHIHTIHTDGVSFTLLPFRDRRSLSASTCDEAIESLMFGLVYELSSIPITNSKVCIGHLAIEGSFYTDEFDDVSNELMVPNHWFNGYDYVWMGHVHTPQVMQKEPTYIAHVGSMDISDFGSANQTKIIVLFDPESPEKFKHINIPSRGLVRLRFEIPLEEDPTEFLLKEIANVSEKINKSIIKVEIKILNPDSASIDRDIVIEKLNSLGAYHIASFSESKASVIINSSKSNIQDNAIKPKDAVKQMSETIDYIDEQEKEEFISLCNEVIEEQKAKDKK
jgi:DNA repair exonuclease SbcCD nuclease subunit